MTVANTAANGIFLLTISVMLTFLKISPTHVSIYENVPFPFSKIKNFPWTPVSLNYILFTSILLCINLVAKLSTSSNHNWDAEVAVSLTYPYQDRQLQSDSF